MSRIIRPLVSPTARIIALVGATLWVVASIVLSAAPEPAGAAEADTTYELLLSLDEFEGATGLVYNPRPFVAADGRLYIVDTGNQRVLRLARDELTRADVVYGRSGDGPGEMRSPRGVAVDASGNVFVADSRLSRISKFTPDGTFLTAATLPKAAAVLVTSAGDVLAYPAPGSALLQRFSNNLEQLETVLDKRHPDRPSRLTTVLFSIDSQDRLYVLEQEDYVVTVYDAGFQLIDQWSVDPPGFREETAARIEAYAAKAAAAGIGFRLNAIRSLSVDPTGRRVALVYHSPRGDEFDSKVCLYTANGTLERVEQRAERKLSSVALDALGHLIEADQEIIEFWGPERTRSGDN